MLDFFILQYAKQRMLELYYIFFKKFCDTDKYEEIEMDTDSLHLALSEGNFEDIILLKKRAEWDTLRSKDCTDNFTVNDTDNLSPRTCCNVHKKHDRESRVSSKKSLDVHKCCVSVAKHIVVMISKLTSTSLAAKNSIKEHWKILVMVDQ